MEREEIVELAVRLHDHMSPGIALGIRMAEIAYKKLNVNFRGKGLVGVAETSMCLPDALQAVAGTTPGKRNLIVREYGKLALTIATSDTMEGYRVTIKKDAAEKSELIKKFLYRLGKLTREEMTELAEKFLNLEDDYFEVRKVRLTIPVSKKKEAIVECCNCGELQPLDFVVESEKGKICLLCEGEKYFEDVKTEQKP